MSSFISRNAPVIAMTHGGGGGTRDWPGSFVKEYVTHQRQFVILHFPVGGKFAITAAQVKNLDVSDCFYKSDFRFSSAVKYENLDHKKILPGIRGSKEHQETKKPSAGRASEGKGLVMVLSGLRSLVLRTAFWALGGSSLELAADGILGSGCSLEPQIEGKRIWNFQTSVFSIFVCSPIRKLGCLKPKNFQTSAFSIFACSEGAANSHNMISVCSQFSKLEAHVWSPNENLIGCLKSEISKHPAHGFSGGNLIIKMKTR